MVVSWAIPHCFGVPAQFLGHVTLGTRFKGDTKNSSFLCSMAASWVIPQCFGVPAQFLGPVNLGTRFLGNTKNSSFRELFHTVLGSQRNF
jgi:hypothetical protein